METHKYMIKGSLAGRQTLCIICLVVLVMFMTAGTGNCWWGSSFNYWQPPSPIYAIVAGQHHTIGIRQDGTVAVWGDNTYGQLAVPAGLSGVVAVAAGLYHSVALKSDGTVVVWGNNSYGQLAVPWGLAGVKAIAAGHTHTLALKYDGTVVAWGNNNAGQCNVPANLTGVVAITAGATHSVALSGGGTYQQWGLVTKPATGTGGTVSFPSLSSLVN